MGRTELRQNGKGGDDSEATTMININLPNTEELCVEKQGLKMNVFILSNILSNTNAIGPKPKIILGLAPFQCSKFNQLGFLSASLLNPLKYRICLLIINLNFTSVVEKTMPSYQRNKCLLELDNEQG